MIQSDKDEEIRIFGEEYANIVYGHEGEAWILRDVSPDGTRGITAESNHVIDRCGFTNPVIFGISECIRPVIQVDKSFIDGLDGEIKEIEKLDKENASSSADEEMMDDEMADEAVEEDGNPFAEIINGDALEMFNLKSVLGVYVQENGGTDVWMVDDRFYYDLLESWDNSIEPSYHYEFIELSHSY